MTIPPEAIESIPRPLELLNAIGRYRSPYPVGHPKEIRDRIPEGVRYIPVEQPETTDDFGFPPFCDDSSTRGKKALAKIRSRVQKTALAEETFNGR